MPDITFPVSFRSKQLSMVHIRGCPIRPEEMSRGYYLLCTGSTVMSSLKLKGPACLISSRIQFATKVLLAVPSEMNNIVLGVDVRQAASHLALYTVFDGANPRSVEPGRD